MPQLVETGNSLRSNAIRVEQRGSEMVYEWKNGGKGAGHHLLSGLVLFCLAVWIFIVSIELAQWYFTNPDSPIYANRQMAAGLTALAGFALLSLLWLMLRRSKPAVLRIGADRIRYYSGTHPVMLRSSSPGNRWRFLDLLNRRNKIMKDKIESIHLEKTAAAACLIIHTDRKKIEIGKSLNAEAKQWLVNELNRHRMNIV